MLRFIILILTVILVLIITLNHNFSTFTKQNCCSHKPGAEVNVVLVRQNCKEVAVFVAR